MPFYPSRRRAGPAYIRRRNPPHYGGNGTYRRAFGTRRYGATYRGRGAYTYNKPGRWGKAGRWIGRALGTAYGGAGGGMVGEKIGGLLHYPARLWGSGAYGVSKSNANIMAPILPEFRNSPDDAIVVTHKEYIGDIVTSSAAGDLSVQDFYINPGTSSTFPWLAGVAQSSFQQYKFEGCVFQFKSSSGDALNSTNTALGSVIGAVNYDSSDQTFTSRIQMENTDWSQNCKPNQDMEIGIECAGPQTAFRGLLYVANNGYVPDGADPKLYYLGRLSIATIGFQAASVHVGALYVTYKIKLYKPVMLAPLTNALITNLGRTGSTDSLPFGNANYTSAANGNQFNISIGAGLVAGGSRITFDRTRLQVGMRILVEIRLTGTSAVVQSATQTTQGLYGSPYQNNFTSAHYYSADASTTGDYLDSYFYTINDLSEDPWIDWQNDGNFPTSSASMTINICQICGTELAYIGGVV